MFSVPICDPLRRPRRGGGTQPRWRRDGGELYYGALDQNLMAVAVETDSGGFKSGPPQVLFHTQLWLNGVGTDEFVPSADGQRFLLAYSLEERGTATPVTVVLNWKAGFKTRR